MLRRILKIAAWIFGSVLGLAVAFYLLVLFINRNDREPSATVLRFEETYRNRPTVSDADNAYIYILGMDSPVGTDPMKLGLQRVAWLNMPNKEREASKSIDPLDEIVGTKTKRNAKYESFYKACGRNFADCRPTYDDLETLQTVLKGEYVLLERYQKLISHSGWLEGNFYDFSNPTPSYSLALDGQRLLLAQVMLLAHRKDFAGVNRFLSADIRFWRMALESSDLLISKMIATAALQRHFQISNLILRATDQSAVPKAMPIEWQTPISDEERSILRPLIGEWMSMTKLLKETGSASGELLFASEDDPKPTKLLSSLGSSLFQPQDTINKITENLSMVAEITSAPLNTLEDATRATTEKLVAKNDRDSVGLHLYNPIGEVLAAIPAPNYTQYIVRVADLEGIRRTAVLATHLRAAGIKETDVSASLITSTIRNPYDDKPFEWNAELNAIVFKGLEEGERGVHKFYY